jgi:hypothetical protein
MAGDLLFRDHRNTRGKGHEPFRDEFFRLFIRSGDQRAIGLSARHRIACKMAKQQAAGIMRDFQKRACKGQGRIGH